MHVEVGEINLVLVSILDDDASVMQRLSGCVTTFVCGCIFLTLMSGTGLTM